jgi:solute carrier family 9B (sodium/hydrogen exchanger), member 1/2
MLELRDRGLGMDNNVPVLVLAGASIDDVFAITVFSAFLTAAGGGRVSPVLSAAWVPVEIVGGILLGLLAGYLLVILFKRAGFSPVEELLVLTATAILVTLLGKAASLAGLLAVMSLGFIILEKGDHRASSRLEKSLNNLWLAAQLFLFILIGSAVNIHVAWRAGSIGLLIIMAGLVFRSLGVVIATHRSGLTANERKFCAVAYIPKATVQAAIGGIPLAMGLPAGEVILAIAVLSIITTAPVGAIAIKYSAPLLLRGSSKFREEDQNESRRSYD